MKKTTLSKILVVGLILFIFGCRSQYGSLEAGSSGHLSGYSDEKSLARESESLPRLDEKSTLSDYLTYAALNNPGLEAAFNRWKAALEQITQVKSLPDPRFNYRYYIEPVETRVGAQRQAFGASQMFPWFGKLELQGDAAAQAANAARQRFEAARLKLYYQVKDAYYEYYYIQRAIAILQENVQLLQSFESVVRTRYQVAAASHPDVIRIQVELGKLEDRLKTVEDLQGPVIARLNAALNRPAETPVPQPAQIEERNVSSTDQDILDMVARYNPELAAMEYEIARSKTAIDLAKKNYYPDVTLGIDVINTEESTSAVQPKDSGRDAVIASLSLNIPIWQKKLDAEQNQAKYQYFSAVQSKDQMLNNLNVKTKLALYNFRDGQRKISLYRDTLIPKAEESVKATETSFSAGNNSFTDMIDAQRVMLEFELSYERALADKARSLAELEMLAGQQISSIENSQSAQSVIEQEN
jgi:cobalt-zinc-cadmium efflux system outer membrane protein